MGLLQPRAERRDQGCQVLQEPGIYLCRLAVVTGILLALLAVGLQKAIGTQFLYVAGAGYWSGVGEANIAGFNLWPPILAVALTGSPIVVLLIGIGYILNSFQIANNIMIGTTRIMVAASLDRAMPEWFSRVMNDSTPRSMHMLFFFTCSISAYHSL